jgi:streptogramin lyase
MGRGALMRRNRVLLVLTVTSAMVALGIPVGATTGDITEFTNNLPTPSSSPWDIVSAVDGNLWFSDHNALELGRCTPTGSITMFSATTSTTNMVGIAADRQGNVWYSTGDGIDRVTTAGGVTKSTHTFLGQIQSLALGPDGNIWFTEEGTDAVGRITPSGGVKEYTTGLTPNTAPDGIAAGMDGSMYFVEYNGPAIGRVTMTGTITERPINIAGSNPTGITAGPDGNVWFGDSGTNSVGRLKPGGAIREFPVAGGPAELTSGADGALWATIYTSATVSSGSIERVGTGGARQAFKIGDNVSPRGIALGPDGNVWFTEQGGGAPPAIGRVLDTVAGRGYVLVQDNFLVPVARTVAQGSNVQWTFLGPNTHTVADTSGMNLFNSKSRSFVTYFTHRFDAAGTYGYDDPAHPQAMTGSIRVPTLAQPSTGTKSTAFTVTWSAAVAPTGHVFDVQVKRPGSSTYVTWKSGVTGRHASFTPDHGTGKYSFRARLRKTSNDTHTGWSPAVTISVT